MSQDNLNLFGFQSDNDESLISSGGSSRVFGLNQGVSVVKVEYRPKDMQGNDNPSINIELEDSTGGKFYHPIYSSITVYDPNGRPRTDTDAADYKEKWMKELKQVKSVLTHFATKGVDAEQYKQKYEQANPKNMAEMFEFAAGAMQALVTKNVKLDVFLQYQWNFKKENTRTFLELPSNMKNDIFLAPDTTGTEWTEIRDKEGLSYVNARGEKHPFKRSVGFLSQPWAKEQTRNNNQDLEAGAAAMNSGSASNSSNWL